MTQLSMFVIIGREPMDMVTLAAPSTTGQREKGEEDHEDVALPAAQHTHPE